MKSTGDSFEWGVLGTTDGNGPDADRRCLALTGQAAPLVQAGKGDLS